MKNPRVSIRKKIIKIRAEISEKETKNMNRPIPSTEIKTVIKNLQTSKSPGPDGFTGESYQK